jgi:hypothetical protein
MAGEAGLERPTVGILDRPCQVDRGIRPEPLRLEARMRALSIPDAHCDEMQPRVARHRRPKPLRELRIRHCGQKFDVALPEHDAAVRHASGHQACRRPVLLRCQGCESEAELPERVFCRLHLRHEMSDVIEECLPGVW